MDKKIDDLSTSDIIWLANEYIHHERNRRIFIERYTQGTCYEPLAEKEDLSVNQVKNILKDSMRKVMKHVIIDNNVIRVVR